MTHAFSILFVRTHDDTMCITKSKYCVGQSTTTNSSAEDQYPFLGSVGGIENKDSVKEIKRLLTALPAWVPPHIVFPESAVKTLKNLGYGQYGQVQQGIFKHGNAV